MKKIILLALFFIAGLYVRAQVAYTSFEEPPVVSGQYTDTGDASVAHDLVNNSGEPIIDFTSTGGEMGFNARYVPYDTPGVGLTDGDYVGVTAYTGGGVSSYPDGSQGYQISDTDGNYILEFDVVDLTGYGNNTVSIDYFIRSIGYEGDGTVNESGSDRMRIYVKDLTNNTEYDILNTTGSDINDLNIEGVWHNGSVNLPDNIQAQLVVEVRTNSGNEALFIDNIVFDGTLSFENQKTNTFRVYPNPVTSGFVYIESDTDNEISVTVFDVLGKQLSGSTLNNNKLNVSNLKKGVYILKITDGYATSTQKLIIK
jgi:hypothetical protein